MNRTRLYVLILTLLPQVGTAGKLQFYRDDVHRLSIQYPEGWVMNANHAHPNTILKLSNPSGGSPRTCSINIFQVPALKRVHADQYFIPERLRKIQADALSGMRAQHPDLKMKASGLTKVSNQAAFWTESEFGFGSIDVQVTVNSYEVRTNRGEDFYTMTCMTTKDSYGHSLPTFKGILGSVLFYPKNRSCPEDRGVDG